MICICNDIKDILTVLPYFLDEPGKVWYLMSLGKCECRKSWYGEISTFLGGFMEFALFPVVFIPQKKKRTFSTADLHKYVPSDSEFRENRRK